MKEKGILPQDHTIADRSQSLLSVVVLMYLFTQSSGWIFGSFRNLQYCFPINHRVAFT